MSSSRSLSTGTLLRPGISDGFYPERPPESSTWLDTLSHTLSGLTRDIASSKKKWRKTIESINIHGSRLETIDEAGLADTTRELRVQLHSQGLTSDLVCQAFALVREVADRTIGMRHFDSQLIGGWLMVHGHLAEMETGEGKTLAATLSAATAALAGIPVHVVTVNDFLVTRDVELMGLVYRKLGLSVAAVTSDQDEPTRRLGYNCDITYCTNKQLAFDYLRDRIQIGGDQNRLRLKLERLHDPNGRTSRLFLRGLCFAIIDEADSVLIDEARTPLIISRQISCSEEEELYRQAMSIAAELTANTHFTIDHNERRVKLSDAGSDFLDDRAAILGKIWKSTRQREELVQQALSAHYLYERDRHYLVKEDKVMIIDENTGRVMADRSWERGLHQMIEIKENCALSGQQEHIGRLTYQRFFRRYLHLSGMTGTAHEVRREMWSVYHLPVTRVPTHKPCRRRGLGQRIYPGKAAKWSAVVDRVCELHEQNRPVLVGTRSVGDSELLSELLEKDGLEHQVLNARQDAEEAQIIARAGQQGCITVATNMAGRGTDIPLGRGVAENGGLHVISTERNDARRIDRQLFGRCGRQGDRGSYESFLSLEDEIFQNYYESFFHLISLFVNRIEIKTTRKMVSAAMGFAQLSRERKYRRMRQDLLQTDEQLGRLLAFSGKME